MTTAVTTPPAHGTYAGGIYTPALNYNGPDSIGFKVTSNTGQIANGTVVDHGHAGERPTSGHRRHGRPRPARCPSPITLGGTDPDGPGTLTYTVLTGPTKGTLSGTAPNLTYTPDRLQHRSGRLHLQGDRQRRADRQRHGRHHDQRRARRCPPRSGGQPGDGHQARRPARVPAAVHVHEPEGHPEDHRQRTCRSPGVSISFTVDGNADLHAHDQRQRRGHLLGQGPPQGRPDLHQRASPATPASPPAPARGRSREPPHPHHDSTCISTPEEP